MRQPPDLPRSDGRDRDSRSLSRVADGFVGPPRQSLRITCHPQKGVSVEQNHCLPPHFETRVKLNSREHLSVPESMCSGVSVALRILPWTITPWPRSASPGLAWM